jgi:hypothetical protein
MYRFHVLRFRTHFRWYRGRRVPFSCFARPDMFLAEPRASAPVFMFCVPRLIFGGTEGYVSHFHVLHARTYFRWYRGHQVPYSCFALPGTFSAVQRALGIDFMFCAPGLVVGDTEGIGSRFLVLRSRARFRRYRGRPIPFSCFPLHDIFRRYRGRRVPLSCFARPDSFSAVPKASRPLFIFCALGLIFSITECVGSRFHALRSDSFSAVPMASGPVFMFCAPGLVFDGTEGAGSCFHDLRSPTHFRRFRGRRVPFSSFAHLDSFSAVMRAPGPVFMFCALEHVFDGPEGDESRFHVLRV